MFKVISAEFKKILSKPGIYILSLLLAIILVLGVFIYHPTIYKDTSFTLEGETYLEKYTQFMGNIGGDKKSEIDTNINNAVLYVSNYRVLADNQYISTEEYIEECIIQLETSIANLIELSKVNASSQQIETTRTLILTHLTTLNNAINNAMIKSSTGSYNILTTKNNYNQFKHYYELIYDYFDAEISKDNIISHCANYDKIYKTKFYNSLDSFIYPSVSDSFITNYTSNTLGTDYYILNTRLEDILMDINEAYTLAKENESQNKFLTSKMDKLANEYMNTANTYINLVKYELLSNAFASISVNDKLNIMYIQDYSEFNCNSLLTRYTYLFENDMTEEEYAHPLTIGVTSNNSTNAYDYAYFVLRLFSFVIIAYAVMMACHTIAGEVKDGSIRYYAIRPASRSDIFFGKLLSIIILSTILLIFSGIISIIVGGAVYGFSSLNILTIFNGTTPMIMHPIAMIGVYLVSVLLELIIYTSIAMLFSTIFKSDLFSVTFIIVIYLINTLLPVFINGYNTWLTFYPFSHINLYSLFGSSVYAVNNDFFNILLGAKVYIGTNIILTLCVTIVIIIITNIIANRIFKYKEL